MTEPHTHFIPILEVNRWIPDKADAFGSSRQDDAARFESGALGEESDSLTDVEYLVAETGFEIVNFSSDSRIELTRSYRLEECFR